MKLPTVSTCTTVHIHDVNEIKTDHAGPTVWINIGPSVTVFIHNVDEVNTLMQALNDAGNLLANAMKVDTTTV